MARTLDDVGEELIRLLRLGGQVSVKVAERYLKGRDDVLRKVLKMVDSGATQAQIISLIHKETSTLQAALSATLVKQGVIAGEVQAGASASALSGLGVTTPKVYNVTRSFIQRAFNKVMHEQNITINNLLTGSMAKLDQDIVNISRRAVLQGETIRTIAQAIEASAGVLSDASIVRKANALARSAIAQISNSVRMAAYKAETQVDRVLYVGTLDHRTTDRCKVLDGNVYPKDKAVVPPVHVSCRSTLVPVLKGEKVSDVKDQLTRPAVEPKSVKQLNEQGLHTSGGRVRKPSKNDHSPLRGVQKNSYQSYAQWLKTQPVAYQRAILGPKAYDSFHSSGDLGSALGIVE